MKKSLLMVSTALLGTLWGSLASATDFQKSLEVYDKREYVTALRYWTALAEQGDAAAQYNLRVIYRYVHGGSAGR